jgi:hypothetical protein
MILVRTNPKLAIAIVCITLLGSMFTVWRVTSTTDKVAQQGIELQQQAQKSVDNAINAAKTQPGVSTDAQAQLDAAQKQLEAATAEH